MSDIVEQNYVFKNSANMNFISNSTKSFLDYFAKLLTAIIKKMGNKFQHIDTSQLETLAGGDKEFMKEMAEIFLEQINEFVTNMSSFLQEKNWEKLAREAHTAKSSAMTFGMDDTGSLLKNIQLECEAGNLDDVPKMVADAIDQLQAAIPELKELL
ncbi:Hpt domain-containing protein [Draconibacterium orientale]|uniref:Hpt domain-containing protein n=1 Tax=Draconibacterium orientale TaxID=1168034 RepID=UPI002A0A4562|nr:Hpt domain-containing protein [Draconibacterium orientale]